MPFRPETHNKMTFYNEVFNFPIIILTCSILLTNTIDINPKRTSEFRSLNNIKLSLTVALDILLSKSTKSVENSVDKSKQKSNNKLNHCKYGNRNKTRPKTKHLKVVPLNKGNSDLENK